MQTAISFFISLCIIRSIFGQTFNAVERNSGSNEVVSDKLNVTRLKASREFFINLRAISNPIDVYLLTDNTNFMQSAVQTLKEDFKRIISAVKKDPAFLHPRFGVGSFKDETTAGTDFGFANIQALTSNEQLVQSAVDKYHTINGGDYNDAHLVGLYKVATDATIGWRNSSQKIIVHISDSVGHEPTCGNFGSRRGILRHDVVRALRKKKIAVIGINLSISKVYRRPLKSPLCPGPLVQARSGQLEFITKGTGGILRHSGKEDLIEDIVDAIQMLRVPSRFTVDSSECDGKLNFVYEPNLPVTIAPGDTSTVEVKQTVFVSTDACPLDGSGAEFKCRIRYLGNGVNLSTKSISGCRTL